MAHFVAQPSSGGGSPVERYNLTAKQSEGGTISPTSASVSRGGSKTFTIKANDGYAIEDVLVDGVSVGAVASYTFENVTASHTITAKFQKQAASASKFTDVAGTDWFAAAVRWAVDEGLMNGTSETTFAPQAKTNRAMVLTMLYRQAGSPGASGSGAWYEDAQRWAVQEGVSDGTNVLGEITREQLVTMLWRASGSPKSDATKLEGFTDAQSVSAWAKDAVSWAVSIGVLNGKGANQLDPSGAATRAETAAMFMRLALK